MTTWLTSESYLKKYDEINQIRQPGQIQEKTDMSLTSRTLPQRIKIPGRRPKTASQTTKWSKRRQSNTINHVRRKYLRVHHFKNAQKMKQQQKASYRITNTPTSNFSKEITCSTQNEAKVREVQLLPVQCSLNQAKTKFDDSGVKVYIYNYIKKRTLPGLKCWRQKNKIEGQLPRTNKPKKIGTNSKQCFKTQKPHQPQKKYPDSDSALKSKWNSNTLYFNPTIN